MTGLDHLIILLYICAVTYAGWWAGKRGAAGTNASSDHERFFLAGRNLSGWAAGTSMVATTLAADTPLVVAGLTLTKGVAGNWFWWAMAISHVLTGVVLARYWRRTGALTDAAFCELRYSGNGAAFLRGLKAFYFAVPINCIVLGWVILAMQKVGSVVLPEIPETTLTVGLLVLVLFYSLRSGFQGVVATDILQFPIALGGAILLAWMSIDAAGGLGAVIETTQLERGASSIAMFPAGSPALPWESLIAFLGVQWWAQKNADGGGILVQRLLATRSEKDAAIGGLWFCVAHYVLRPWPWILTGLAAAILVPGAVEADPEAAYAALIIEVLPVGLRGLLVAAFLAAFMSTVDTHLNWGASYLSHDLAERFGGVSPAKQKLVARISVVVLACLAVLTASFMESIEGAWEFLIAFGAGSGATMLLRWVWWRVSAWTETSAIIASTVLSVGVYALAPEWAYLSKLAVIVLGSAAIWLTVTWKFPADPAHAAKFHEKVLPPGPGWAKFRTPGSPTRSLGAEMRVWAIGSASIYSLLFGAGGLFLGSPTTGLALTFFGAVGIWHLSRRLA